jgi:hypothetical protein
VSCQPVFPGAFSDEDEYAVGKRQGVSKKLEAF